MLMLLIADEQHAPSTKHRHSPTIQMEAHGTPNDHRPRSTLTGIAMVVEAEMRTADAIKPELQLVSATAAQRAARGGERGLVAAKGLRAAGIR